MNRPERMKQVQSIFQAALEMNEDERAGYLQEINADDPALHSEVEALLSAHFNTESFLEAPATIPDSLTDAETLLQKPAAPQTISHYEVVSLLGKGGMGEVYLATDTTLGRKAALKILPARYTSEADSVHRFEREAKAASALNHPNILTVYEIGQTDESHFIATEFIEGLTLRQHMRPMLPPLSEALDIAIQIAAALNAAHEAGIIHRDIKPENIMLRPDGYVKVLDFGLAKLTEAAPTPDESTTQTGMIMGTPSYMSPEQARGQKVDYRTDIWSLGIVLYELVSGARPFGGESQADLLVAILDRFPSPLPNHLPSELQSIIAIALAKEPSQRYASMQDMLNDLKSLRRKVEFEAALSPVTFSKSNEATTLRLPSNASETSPLTTPAPTEKIAKTARYPLRSVIIGTALVGVLVAGSWYIFKPELVSPPPPAPVVATPKYQLTWWLTVQRMQNGKLEAKAFQSSGRDWFPNGSKFKFNMISPQAGFLYLLNEGPTFEGRISLNLLYPTPANNNLNAAVSANEMIQTFNYVFSDHEGEEKLWVVWSANPIPEIEEVKESTIQAEINRSAKSEAIQQLLQEHAKSTTTKISEAQEQTLVAGDGVLAQMVRLKHR